MSNETPKVVDYLPAFTVALVQQLMEDEERWGDEWLRRPRLSQKSRIFKRIREYYDVCYDLPTVPMPWTKIAGLALIGWIRDNYTELSESWQ